MNSEPWSVRWKRRAVTIPTMLAATAVGVAGAPLIVPVAMIRDIVRLRFDWPTLRIYLFLLQYALNDSVEIFASPVLWIRAGLGTRLGSEVSIGRHERLQAWSVDMLARRAERLLRLRLTPDADALRVLEPVPAIVLCRHVSLLDASLPALLFGQIGIRTRAVIMAELLADPGFDLLYRRTGSVFITRDGDPAARTAIARLGSTLDSQHVAVMFPEGRLFRPERCRTALERLTASDPERALRLAGLRHVLPPRTGGVLALLDASDVDVVVVAHRGLERFGTLRDLAAAVPVSSPIEVTAWRTPRAEIPDADRDRIAWLDEQWLRVDEWIDRGQ